MSSIRSVLPDTIAADAIIDAALDVVVAEGLAELSLRPLALKVGVSVTAMSTVMGSKDALIARVIDTAADRDRQFHDRWLTFAKAVAPRNAAERTAIADLAFRDWVVRHRRHACLLIELVHTQGRRECALPQLDAWLDRAACFWAEMIFGDTSLAELALGYVIDEAGFALGGSDDPHYAGLRTLCLQRLAMGIFAPHDVADSADAPIPRLIALLRPPDASLAIADDPKRRHIADCAAEIIVSQGMAAVTHRSVALASGVPASTVVYHFGARESLVVAGLHAVIARFHTSLKPDGYDQGEPAEATARNLVKATSMIALASAREPSLLPQALDMRRRRGENIRSDDVTRLGLPLAPGFDRAAAQVISIAVFGMRMVAMARQISEQANEEKAFAAFAAWRAHGANAAP